MEFFIILCKYYGFFADSLRSATVFKRLLLHRQQIKLQKSYFEGHEIHGMALQYPFGRQIIRVVKISIKLIYFNLI